MPAASDRKTAKSSTSRGRERPQSARRTSNTRGSSQRSAAARKSGNGARSKASSKASNGASSKAGNGARSKASNGARSKASSKAGNGARSKATEARSKASNGAQSEGNSQQDHAGREALTALLGATVGVAGGVLLGRTALSRDRKVLGVPVPKKIDLAGVGQQIGEAGRQLGRLAGEVRGVREKAEQIGRVLS